LCLGLGTFYNSLFSSSSPPRSLVPRLEARERHADLEVQLLPSVHGQGLVPVRAQGARQIELRVLGLGSSGFGARV
jgi:hypothetical protein